MEVPPPRDLNTIKDVQCRREMSWYIWGISSVPRGMFSPPHFSRSVPWGDIMVHEWGCFLPPHLSCFPDPQYWKPPRYWWYPPRCWAPPPPPPTVLNTHYAGWDPSLDAANWAHPQNLLCLVQDFINCDFLSHPRKNKVFMHRSIPSTNIPPGDPRGFALHCCPRAGIYTWWPSPGAGFLHIHKITFNTVKKYTFTQLTFGSYLHALHRQFRLSILAWLNTKILT